MHLRAAAIVPRLVIAGGVGALVGLFAPVVHACSLPCRESLTLPSSASLPSNRVSFEVVADPGLARLETEEGAPIASHIVTRGGVQLFEPIDPIPAGTAVVLTFEHGCSGVTPTREYRFVTDPAEDDVVVAGQLQLKERGVAWPDRPDSMTAYVRLAYREPYLASGDDHLVRHRATVDGHSVNVSSRPDGLEIEIPTQCRLSREEFIPGLCPGLASAPPGRHTVVVVSQRLGDEIPTASASLEIESVCPEDIAFGASDTGTGEALPDGTRDDDGAEADAPSGGTAADGTQAAGSSAGAPAAGDGQPQTSAQTDAVAARSSAGCSVRASDAGRARDASRASGLAAGLLAALAVVAVRRSRR